MSSRLPYDKMTFEETTMFRDIISEDPLQHTTQFDSYKKFLFVRNKILHMWVDNPKVQLVVEDVFQNFDPLKFEENKIYFSNTSFNLVRIF